MYQNLYSNNIKIRVSPFCIPLNLQSPSYFDLNVLIDFYFKQKG